MHSTGVVGVSPTPALSRLWVGVSRVLQPRRSWTPRGRSARRTVMHLAHPAHPAQGVSLADRHVHSGPATRLASPAKILCVTLSFGGVTPLRVHLMAGFEASSVICVPSGATFNTRLLFWLCDIHVLCRRPWRDGREGGMGQVSRQTGVPALVRGARIVSSESISGD
jgi:hypothetical protein